MAPASTTSSSSARGSTFHPSPTVIILWVVEDGLGFWAKPALYSSEGAGVAWVGVCLAARAIHGTLGAFEWADAFPELHLTDYGKVFLVIVGVGRDRFAHKLEYGVPVPVGVVALDEGECVRGRRFENPL